MSISFDGELDVAIVPIPETGVFTMSEWRLDGKVVCKVVAVKRIPE